jgi:hypothetical protein
MFFFGQNDRIGDDVGGVIGLVISTKKYQSSQHPLRLNIDSNVIKAVKIEKC